MGLSMAGGIDFRKLLFVAAGVISSLSGEKLAVSLPHAAVGPDSKCVFPDVLVVSLARTNTNIEWNIELKRGDVIPRESFVFLLTDSTNTGVEKFQIDNNQHDEAQSYHNEQTGAAFVVKCIRQLAQRPFFSLDGSVFIAGKKYRIVPSLSWWKDTVVFSNHVTTIYSLTEIEEFKVENSAAKMPPNNHYPPYFDPEVSRTKRDVTLPATYTIDVLPVVDRSLYAIFDNQTGGKTVQTKINIDNYLNILFTGVNMRLNTLSLSGRTLQVRRLPAFLITPSSSFSSPYEGQKLDNTDGVPSISATLLLGLFKDWLLDRASALGVYDHAMFFTALDIYGGQDSGIKFNLTTGLAYRGTMCTIGDSASVIEDHGAYQNEGVAAHECAHSLGSYHDGEDNACSSAERNIMSDGSYESTDATNLNPWKFSQCTSNYILNFLMELEKNRNVLRDCLLQSRGSLTDVSRTISANEQCKLFYGSSSFICRGNNLLSLDNICDEFYCRIPTKNNTCGRLTAATGTCCGNQKKCMLGRCVSAAKGECPMNDVCPLGDQEGVILNNKTCAQLESQYCYSDDINLRCCNTCRKYWNSSNDGCEYGDKQVGCKADDCGKKVLSGDFKDLSYSFPCCATCNSKCVNINDLSLDGTVFTCDEYIINRGNKYICYTHASHCCKSCEEARDVTDHDCPWGDRNNCSALLKAPPGYTCNSTQEQSCCKTCSLLPKRVATTAVRTSTVSTSVNSSTSNTETGNGDTGPDVSHDESRPRGDATITVFNSLLNILTLMFLFLELTIWIDSYRSD